jgi:ankyrin repeat protein
MPEPLDSFLSAALSEGPLEPAAAILAANPGLPGASIHAAAALGEEAIVRRLLAVDPAAATLKTGERELDPLTCLCFSMFLRLEPEKSAAFLRTAQALLDAGANAGTGFYSPPDEQTGHRWFGSAIYGAAAVARHPELTRLLLERGADPNDEETPYHTPETRDNRVLAILVESGRLNADSLETMLLRKADWHDGDGMKYLLEHGADPNRMTRWPQTALHQALRRDNALDTIELLLQYGAEPRLVNRRDGRSAVQIAVDRGRGDVLAAFAARGMSLDIGGDDALVAACATDDGTAIAEILSREPGGVEHLVARGGALLAEFAGNGNTPAVGRLLELGVNPNAIYEGDPYFAIAPGATALHVAAWRARHDTVRLLLERGAAVHARDAQGRTPVALAVRAAVDSYWTHLRSPESVRLLLAAGASLEGVAYPCGYEPIDALLRLASARSGPPTLTPDL